MVGQVPRQRSRADVDGDVTAQIHLRQAERTQRFRQYGAGMIADQHDLRLWRAVDHVDGRWVGGTQQSSGPVGLVGER